MDRNMTWDEEAEVVIVGYGGAGAVAAITAHDAGARVLILEKQPADTATETRHTPSTRMSAGWWSSPDDWEKAFLYFKGLLKIANEIMDGGYEEAVRIFSQYSVENNDWMTGIGLKLLVDEKPKPDSYGDSHAVLNLPGRRLGVVDFPDLPGADRAFTSGPAPVGKYRDGAAFFKALSDAVTSRAIPVRWESPAVHLIVDRGEVRGVIARREGREVAIKASRAVILTCGGFEFDQRMKQDFLRVSPVHFYGSPAVTGDGVKMAMEIGAGLWHMSAMSARVVMKYPDFPCAFGTQHHSKASIIIDKRGRRFTNERFKIHAFGYELIDYDCYAMCYPKVPCYWFFDEKRRTLASLATQHGVGNPPGGIMGDIYYNWDDDNQKEIDRGWILKGNTLEELANRLRKDPDNGGLMSSSVLTETVKRYNELCRRGEDLDFHKSADLLKPFEDPPYYAAKLWVGGPNTQGGPKRNARGQVLHVDDSPIPRLYSAGELGSIWGMMYQAGGNLAECIVFGRISGANAAMEKPWR